MNETMTKLYKFQVEIEFNCGTMQSQLNETQKIKS